MQGMAKSEKYRFKRCKKVIFNQSVEVVLKSIEIMLNTNVLVFKNMKVQATKSLNC